MDESPKRGYFLLMTPLDLHASTESLIRNYVMVIENSAKILPNLPPECAIELFAGGTPHNSREIPLLGLHTPPDSRQLLPDPMIVQDWIDQWFSNTSRDTIHGLLEETTIPSWAAIMEHGPYPFQP